MAKAPTTELPRIDTPRLARSEASDRALMRVIVDWTNRYSLTLPQAAVLLEATKRASAKREDIARVRAVAPGTVKTHVSRVLKKTGSPSMAHACLCIYSEALVETAQ